MLKMADAGDRAALLSYQDDAELAQIDPHTVEASDEFNPARGRRQKFLSLFHKTGSFGAFIRLNLITTVTALVLIVLFGGFIAPLYDFPLPFRVTVGQC